MFQSAIEVATQRFRDSHQKAVALMSHYVSPVAHMAALMEAVKGHDQVKYEEYLRRHEHYVMTLAVHHFRIGPVLLNYAVDNFAIHASELLRLIFREKPETLKADLSEMKLPALEVLDTDNVREVIVRKRIAQIDGRGFRGMLDFLRKLGVADVLTAEEESDINRVIADRNLMTHQGGVIDEEYLRMSGRVDVKVGDRLSVDDPTITWGFDVIEYTAAKLAHAIAAKFNLDVRRNGNHRPVAIPAAPARPVAAPGK